MKHHIRFLWRVLSLLVLLQFVACTGITPMPKNPTPAPTPTYVADLEPGRALAGPKIVRMSPLEGERLSTSAAVELEFDREMQQDATSKAWVLYGPDGQPVKGVVTWVNARTMQFKPLQEFKPSSDYRAVLSLGAVSLDGTALLEEWKYTFHTQDFLIVSAVSPKDGSSNVSPRAGILVSFNRPVVKTWYHSNQENLPVPIEITPPVSGKGEWIGASMYLFRPDEPMTSGTTYTVTVPRDLKDTRGDVQAIDFSWSFTTWRSGITQFYFADDQMFYGDSVGGVFLDQKMVFEFSDPMDVSSSEKAFSLVEAESGDAVPVKFFWNDTNTVLTVSPAALYKVSTRYAVKFSGEARTADGTALVEGLSRFFTAMSRPRVVRFQASTYPYTGASSSLCFATPMDEKSLKDRLAVSPLPETFEWYYDASSGCVNLYGFDPSTEYSLTLRPGAMDTYGNAITEEYSRTFKTSSLPSSAYMLLPYGSPLIYRPGGNQDVYFDYTNIDSAELSLYRLSMDQFHEITSMGWWDAKRYHPASRDLVRVWRPDIDKPLNSHNRVRIELTDLFGKPLAPGFYFITLKYAPRSDYWDDSPYAQTSLLVVATDNMTFKRTSTEAMAWVTDTISGKPVSGLPVTFYNEDFNVVGNAATDGDGLAYLDGVDNAYFASAKSEDGSHFTFADSSWGSGVSEADAGIWVSYYNADVNQTYAYVYTDRPLYRPGQEVFFKGIVRKGDDLHYSMPDAKNANVKILYRGDTVFTGSVALSEFGTFSGSFPLGEDAGVGSYEVYVDVGNANNSIGYVGFRVAEYRKPEFEVGVQAVQANLLAGDDMQFDVDAAYYSGGAVVGAKVNWFIETSPYTFTPSSDYYSFDFSDLNWDDYWWRYEEAGSSILGSGDLKTDESGHASLSLPASLGENKTSQTLSYVVNVTDVAGNLVSGRSSVVVHRGMYYPGVRSLDYIGKAGEEQKFELVVLDWDSNPVAGQDVSVQFVKREWYSVQQKDETGRLQWVSSVKDIPVSQANAVMGADGRAVVSFVPPEGGVFKAIVSTRDPKGNQQKASAFMWITSQEYIPWRQTNDRSFELIADKDSYAPGDTAKILIAQPFQGPVYALVTLERGHIYQHEVILLDGSSTIYEVPVTADMAPIFYMSVVVIRGADEASPPDFKMGLTSINVDTSQQQLNVEISAQPEKAGPGDEVTYTVKTTDVDGQPVQTEVSLALIDKALLALAPSNTGPILESFYPERSLGVGTAVSLVHSADSFNAEYEGTETNGESSGSGGGKGEDDTGVIDVRENFRDTAFWRAQVTTGGNGVATVKVTLPDNMTTWRMDARAVSMDTRVGQATHELVSTRPLYVQLQNPRFFVEGDNVRIGATVHNNTDQPLQVDVSLEAQGVHVLTALKQTVEVAARQQGYVYWNVLVKRGATRVDLLAHAQSGELSDTSRPAFATLDGQGLPVHYFAVSESVGVAGTLSGESSVTEPLLVPAGSRSVLHVETSPSLAASMVDGLTYLQDFPYLCNEQTISRFLPNVVSSQALKIAGLPPSPLQANLDTQVSAAMQKLYNRQNYDGGWGWWEGSDSNELTSAYVLLGMIEARDAGYDVSGSSLQSGLSYLRKQLTPLAETHSTSFINRQAFMMYVLARAGRLRQMDTVKIYDLRDHLDVYGKAFLTQAIYIVNAEDERLPVLISELEAAAVDSREGRHWEESGVDYWNWNTDVRTTAIVVHTLTLVDPKNELLPDAVRWLMSHRSDGYWRSTQETAWVLMALTRWLAVSGEFDTNFQYAVGLDGKQLSQNSADRSNLADPVVLDVNLEQAVQDEIKYIVLARNEGPGNLYYSAQVETFVDPEKVKALDQGIIVSREYFALDDPETPLTSVQKGETVRGRLTIIMPEERHYVIVNDPLPAGLEALDSSLATDAEVPEDITRADYFSRGWGWWWFDYVDLYDEKVVLSADYLPAGTYVFTYLARASTVGEFRVLPVTAWEFYFPDIYGRSDGSLFTVLP